MTEGFDIILRLTTSRSINPNELDRMFKDFSRILGWEPSSRYEPDPDLKDITNGHLVVEHGLEQSAVITFLLKPIDKLEPDQSRKIVGVSYNNLTDWHLYVEKDKVSFIFNRRYPFEPIVRTLSVTDIDSLRSTMFEQITETRQNPNFPSLDNALVENISFWKRNLAAELKGKPERLDYSTLFNAIIFVRAIEDHKRKSTPNNEWLLLQLLEQLRGDHKKVTVANILKAALNKLVNSNISKSLIDLDRLNIFDRASINTVDDLFSSFYKSKNIPYGYDFAIMSKHALSRIYEHYVSLLSFDEDDRQLYFFPPLPSEQTSKSYGSVYTPQFIARFFARFLYARIPPILFRKLVVFDPACGSGIFLRTLLELQCGPTFDGLSSDEIVQIFANSYGVDVDENAAQATKLSMALLYLVLMSGKLPRKLNIETNDSIRYVQRKEKLNNFFDAVIANPPYVAFDNQNREARETILKYLDDLSSKKPDSYLPFLKIAVDVLKPGGFGLFVLPHPFIRTDSAEKIREYISSRALINCLIDLSNIPVFKDKGSYVILLIFQKRAGDSQDIESQKATIIKCQDLVGHALQDFLLGRRTENPFYAIYDVDQKLFHSKEWSRALFAPQELTVREKIDAFQTLGSFFDIRQGVVTGADEVFIIKRNEIPPNENEVWRPLLRDRDMQRYTVPSTTQYYTFYPVLDGKKITETMMESAFPKTWKYLKKNKDRLPHRKQAEKLWWCPTSLRDSSKLFSPKIVTPHLVLVPRFSLDVKGKYVVSHSPFLTLEDLSHDANILKFFLAVLNSTIGSWLLSTHSDKYSRGYARLEVKTLSSIPVPDPSKISPNQITNIIKLVEKKLTGDFSPQIDKDIDNLVAKIYGLTHNEKLVIGFEG